MKTTIEITDSLLDAAKDLARKERTTLRDLVETGLAQVLRDREVPRAFRLRDESFAGTGLQPEFQTAGWDQIRDAIYGDDHHANDRTR